MAKKLIVPEGIMRNQDDEAAAKKRKELRDKLLKGEEVKVTPAGHVKDVNSSKRESGIVVPEGKLAGFYWYENEPKLYKAEKEAMKRYFPQFKLEKLDDGRLYWYGKIETDLRNGGRWYLQAIYDHNHPHNTSYGGSVKVYSIEPDLADIQSKLGEFIPHLLRDANENIYLCTARKEDVDAGSTVTTAASSLSWAAKWIAVFEMWMAGDVSTSQFAGHTF